MMRPGLDTSGVTLSPVISTIVSSYRSSSQLMLKDTFECLARTMPFSWCVVCVKGGRGTGQGDVCDNMQED